MKNLSALWRIIFAFLFCSVASLAHGQTSTAVLNPNKLVYKGSPAYSVSLNKDGVSLAYIDGTQEKLSWDRLTFAAINGVAEDPSACAGTSYALDRPMKGSVLLRFNDAKMLCIPLTAKDAPAAQQ